MRNRNTFPPDFDDGSYVRISTDAEQAMRLTASALEYPQIVDQMRALRVDAVVFVDCGFHFAADMDNPVGAVLAIIIPYQNAEGRYIDLTAIDLANGHVADWNGPPSREARRGVQ